MQAIYASIPKAGRTGITFHMESATVGGKVCAKRNA